MNINSVKPENAATITKVTWYGLIINTMLSIIKLALGYIGDSQVVIADAIHSFSDSITDITIIIGVKFWTAPPDETHPYGHQKIETIVTAAISMILVAVAVGIAYDGIITVKKSSNEMPTAIAIYAPVISIIVKEFLYRWNITVGKKIRSSALIANAWHHRSDVISSIFALITVTIAVIAPKISFVDNIGAVLVAGFILKVAWDLLYSSICDLTDRGASSQIQDEILEQATSVPGVESAHAIRTRINGSSILVDMHILVNGNMTVKNGHDISESVQAMLMKNNPDIIDVVVHIEPAKQ